MIKSINPYNKEEIFEIVELSSDQVKEAIDKADNTFQSWKEVPFSQRSKLMLQAADV